MYFYENNGTIIRMKGWYVHGVYNRPNQRFHQ